MLVRDGRERHRAGPEGGLVHGVGVVDDEEGPARRGMARRRCGTVHRGGGDPEAGVAGGATGRVLLHVDDPDAVAAQALAAGATERAPVADEHGWRLGRITDVAGHEWEIGRPSDRSGS